MKKYIKSIIYGLIFGVGSPIPGVSAGTVAIMLNVYDSFFASFNVGMLKRNWFATCLFLIGWGGGLLSIANGMMFLLTHYKMVVSFIFMGLIIGCVPLIKKKATTEKLQLSNISIFLLALLFMLFIAFNDTTANRTLSEMGGTTPIILAWLFFASFISAMAMLIPGVGGSLMMIVFGIYTVYIEAVASLNVLVLIVFSISMVLGVLAGILITKKLLAMFSQALYCAILGFVVGSLFIIFPGFTWGMEGVFAIILAVGSAVFSFWFSRGEGT